MDEPKILKQLKTIITLALIIAWLSSLALNAAVVFSIPGIDWRTHALGISGGLSTFAFVGHYVFKKYGKL